METVSALPRSQARWEVGSAQLSWDAPERRALSSQIGDNGKTSWDSVPYKATSQNIAKKKSEQNDIEIKQNEALQKKNSNFWEFLKPLQKVWFW